jgi:hypothetical protein
MLGEYCQSVDQIAGRWKWISRRLILKRGKMPLKMFARRASCMRTRISSWKWMLLSKNMFGPECAHSNTSNEIRTRTEGILAVRSPPRFLVQFWSVVQISADAASGVQVLKRAPRPSSSHSNLPPPSNCHYYFEIHPVFFFFRLI